MKIFFDRPRLKTMIQRPLGALATAIIMILTVVADVSAKSVPCKIAGIAGSTRQTATFDLRLARNTWKLGEDPRIHVALTNVGSPFDIHGIFVWDLVTLDIKTAEDEALTAARLDSTTYSAGIMMTRIVEHGRTVVPAYRLSSDDPSNEFAPLSRWGYAALPSGSFNITARPGSLLGGLGEIGADPRATVDAIPNGCSNTVHIVVE